MKLEDQVCQLELAKRLKELGVKQESLYFWCHHLKNEFHGEWWDVLPGSYASQHGAFSSGNEDHVCAAFTVAELGEMLPYEFSTMKGFDGSLWYCSDIRVNDLEIDRMFKFKTEADARAKMLIHLIEKGIVKP